MVCADYIHRQQVLVFASLSGLLGGLHLTFGHVDAIPGRYLLSRTGDWRFCCQSGDGTRTFSSREFGSVVRVATAVIPNLSLLPRNRDLTARDMSQEGANLVMGDA